MSRLVAAAEFAEQADHFEVEPDEGDHDAEGTVPLHEFGCALIDALLDEVEIEDEVVLGFCKSATLEEIRSHGHVLTPGRYVERKKLRMTENRLKKR